MVKIFLNLSPGEQRKRLLARIDDPEKNWKSRPPTWSSGPLDEYQHAYSEVLSHTSTEAAPRTWSPPTTSCLPGWRRRR